MLAVLSSYRGRLVFALALAVSCLMLPAAAGAVTFTSSATVNDVNYDTQQVVVSNGATVTFNRVTFGAYHAGSSYEGRLAVTGNANVIVRDSTFTGGCSDGIQASGGGDITVERSEFSNIKQGSCSPAHVDPIQPYGARSLTVTDSYFHGNSTGIMDPDCNGGTLTFRNNVFATDGEYPDQIVVAGGRGDTFEHNVFANGARIRFGNPNGCGLNTNAIVRNNVISGGLSLTNGQSTSTFTMVSNPSSVTFTGGAGRCGYATASPNGTASDGTDIGLNSCGATTPPPADTTAPNTTITSGPANPTTSTSASIAFTSSESGSTFECKLDTGAQAACTSPKSYSALSIGSHTVSVRATDAAGNVDASPATQTWSIGTGADTTAPDTTITSGPANPTTSTSSSSGFTSSESGSTFSCKLDAGVYASCASPKANSGLSIGSHTFSVRATDVAGNMDATPASQTWMIQSTAPADAQPVAAYVYSPATPAIGQAVLFDASSATCADAPCTYSWADDGGDGAAGTQWPLGSGKTLSFTFQGTGVKNVRLTVTDADGDTNSTMKSINVVATAPPADTTAPNTTFGSGPSGTTNDATPTFTFSSSEGASTFQLRMDSGTWVTHTSPWTARTLSIGAHVLAARATDAAGNTDASPATRSFTVARR